MDHLVLLLAAGFISGSMNALAGGGSFVSLPALIAAGVPSVQANASSTVALFPGGIASAWAYRADVGPVGNVPLRSLFLVTLLGGVAGAILLLSTPTRLFDAVLPWLLLIALVTLAGGRSAGAWLQQRVRIRPVAVLTVQFGLGVYGGYFGGAVGIMMMAIWGLLDRRDIKSLNAPRTILVSATNGMAVMIFIAANAVQWRQTLVMLIAAAAGGYGGALLGRRLPPHIVRAGTLLLTGGITIAFFIRAYL